MTSTRHWIQQAVAAGGLIALCGPLAGCESGKDLSRSAAGDVIRKHEAFAQVQHEQIWLGVRVRATFGIDNWATYDALATAGYLKRDGHPVQLSAAGESACKDTPRDPNRPNLRSFAVANRELVAITGIADAPLFGTAQGGAKEVEFTWRWRPTELGEQLRAGNQTINSRYDPEQLREGVALCRRYDDGWRIEHIKGI